MNYHMLSYQDNTSGEESGHEQILFDSASSLANFLSWLPLVLF